jgi:tripartite-type tricarboxylate transporter receptor subunit TctC
MPPETPEDRVTAVRDAFHEMVRNPDFLDDARRAGMSIDVRSAQDILGILNRIKSAPPAVIEEARKAVVE